MDMNVQYFALIDIKCQLDIWNLFKNVNGSYFQLNTHSYVLRYLKDEKMKTKEDSDHFICKSIKNKHLTIVTTKDKIIMETTNVHAYNALKFLLQVNNLVFTE